METLTSSAALPIPKEPANYDEIAMQQSLLFADSLKAISSSRDLKNLRKQLYAAAEYFELSYTNDDQKQLVVDTLKDYAIKALVNTVDHLGAVSYKVNDILGEKVNEVSATELRVSCIQQFSAFCDPFCMDMEGDNYCLNIELDVQLERPCKVINAIKKCRKGRSPSPSPQPAQQPGSFAFTGAVTRKDLEKRSVSPRRFSLLRTGSLSSRPTTPNSRSNSRSTTPNPSRPTTPTSIGRQRLSEPRKSASMRMHADRETYRETDQIPSKSKRLLKALLSRRKSKKDDMLYTYLDEY
ncbi:hypothetical protein Ccrd_017028 [Cynara cardunculus var. scolymus]|uniref:Uncharacterized protein n=1 Tax=Cynara cardunculus var. scolymus TaxID=59895 RepID=A0A103Y8V4_CYNCS|nr:hypothetical protein Ccrd_017028 [Cynara cardunculus var. scolymus]